MSDYYGDATLESWLIEEVLDTPPVRLDPDRFEDFVRTHVSGLFEPWRDIIEADINNWMASDDGEGNPLSWRGWGRGYANIPNGDNAIIETRIKVSNQKIIRWCERRLDISLTFSKGGCEINAVTL